MTAPRLAWGLFGLFVAIAAVGIFLLLIGRPAEDAFFLSVVGYALAGALVASRLPRNPIGWMLLAIGIVLALGAVVDSNLKGPDPPLRTLSAWLSEWTWYVWLTLAGIFLPLLFPDGRLPSRRWRPALWIGLAALALSVIGAAFMPGELNPDEEVRVPNPLGFGGAAMEGVALAGDLLAGAAFLLAAASLVVRFRRSRGVERQQLKWFVGAALLALAGLAVAMAQELFGLDPGDGGEAGWLEIVGTVAWMTALVAITIAIPAATGVAILRHRLYDIDVVIRRTLVYGALTATLAASYLGTVLLAGLALGDSDVAIALSTLAVAALFRPARARIQGAVDHRFYRRRYDAARTLESFGTRLRDEVDLDAVGAELRGVIGETMQPAHVSLWLRR